MSVTKKLLELTPRYAFGEIIVMAGGFISFPILTRILTREEYGLMSLISVTLCIVEDISSAGIRHAIYRFYPLYLEKGLLKDFYSTTMLSTIAFSVTGTVLIFLASYILTSLGFMQYNVKNIFALASLLITIRCLSKFNGCIFRIRQEANKYLSFAVLTKYMGMLLSIVFVSIYFYGIFGFYLGLVVGEFVVLCLSVYFLVYKMGCPSKAFYSKPMSKEITSYGFPMVISGFAGTILNFGDRYMIGYFMTATDVAIYSVSYNLCNYLIGILLTAFEYAFIPLIMNEMVKSDGNHIQFQLQKVIKMYCLTAIPIIFGGIAIGEHLIILLASKKYAEASFILPYIITGEMVRGLLLPFCVGILYHKNTKVLIKITCYALLLNILINFILIPRLGLLGAALSTLLSYIALLGLSVNASSKYFKIEIPWQPILRYCACALIMFASLKIFTLYSSRANLPILILSGMVIYAFSLVVVDKDIREVSTGLLRKLRAI